MEPGWREKGGIEGGGREDGIKEVGDRGREGGGVAVGVCGITADQCVLPRRQGREQEDSSSTGLDHTAWLLLLPRAFWQRRRGWTIQLQEYNELYYELPR